MDNNEFEQNPEEQTPQEGLVEDLQNPNKTGRETVDDFLNGTGSDILSNLGVPKPIAKKAVKNNGGPFMPGNTPLTKAISNKARNTAGSAIDKFKNRAPKNNSMPKKDDDSKKDSNNKKDDNSLDENKKLSSSNSQDKSSESKEEENKKNNPISDKAKQKVSQATNQLKAQAKEGIKQVFIKLMQSPAGPYIIAGIAIALVLFIVILLIIMMAGGASAANTGSGSYSYTAASTEQLDFMCSMSAPLEKIGVQYITSTFGWRPHNNGTFHRGIDLSWGGIEGSPIYAVKAGKIKTKWSNNKYYGNGVEIQHDNGYVTRYEHMQKVADGLSEGDSVSEGEIIGYVGNTGDSNGAHLHFGIIDSSGNFLSPNAFFGKSDEGMEYCLVPGDSNRPSNVQSCHYSNHPDISFEQVCNSRGVNAGVLTYYYQGDPQWNEGDKYYMPDSCKTTKIAEGGCGPTSMAMLVTATKQKVTPYEMGQLMVQKGYRTCAGGGFGANEANAFQFISNNYGLEYTFTSSKDTLVQKLKEGYYAVGHALAGGAFTAGGHYIFIFGVTDDNKLKIYDPNMIKWDGTLNKPTSGYQLGEHDYSHYGSTPSKAVDSALNYPDKGITIDEENRIMYYDLNKYKNTNLNKFFIYKGPEQSSSGGETIEGTAQTYKDVVWDSNNVTKRSNLTSDQLVKVLNAYGGNAKNFVPYASNYITAENKYNVNAFFLIALHAIESRWITSNVSKACNNLGGWKDFSHPSYVCARAPSNEGSTPYKYFNSKGEFIDYVANSLKNNYLTQGGSHYHGTSVSAIIQDYNVGSQSEIKLINQIASKMFSQTRSVM